MARDKNNQMDWQKVAVYGSVGRLMEALILGYPMNVVRMNYNAYPDKKRIVRSIFQRDGVIGFYKGFRWSIIPSSFGSGFRWVVINVSDSLTARVVPHDYRTTRALSIGLLSPALTTLLLCPFSRMQTWNVTDMHKTTLRQHLINRGFFDLWTGARVTYLRTAIISVMFNITYVNIVGIMIRVLSPFSKDKAATTLSLAVAAAIAAAPHALVTTPMDMIKDQMQKFNGINEYRLFHATRLVYRRHGLFGMYRTAPKQNT